MTKPDDEIVVVKVQGLTTVSKAKINVEEYVIPKPPPGISFNVTCNLDARHLAMIFSFLLYCGNRVRWHVFLNVS